MRVDGQPQGWEYGGAALPHLAQVVEERGDAVAPARSGPAAPLDKAGPEVVAVRLVLASHTVGNYLRINRSVVT